MLVSLFLFHDYLYLIPFTLCGFHRRLYIVLIIFCRPSTSVQIMHVCFAFFLFFGFVSSLPVTDLISSSFVLFVMIAFRLLTPVVLNFTFTLVVFHSHV